jgi:hypothetical protein
VAAFTTGFAIYPASFNPSEIRKALNRSKDKAPNVLICRITEKADGKMQIRSQNI